ncbi:HD domain-containing protein [Niallia nealsonii]|uniref:HD-CE domain-containing protein n=1 Tax=Niallia nealsonii TaxID=115979 RepID=A0A2N0Z4C2_9BACI|nr:ATP-binding protein [Niallia nealsonii]PKG24371.1 hypothetical protein CWS01_07080 [Niallia nealsonii]
MILEDTRLMKELKERDSLFYSAILGVYTEIRPLLDQRIAQVFPTYTQHDSGHSIRIIEHMSQIVNDISNLNDLEIAILVYSAMLHDIGMAANQEEITEIENGTLIYNGLNFNAILNKFNQDRILAMQEYIRIVHAERSANYIKENLSKRFVIPEMPLVSFGDTLALICEAHTKEIVWVTGNLKDRDVKGTFEINPQFCALVLRLADILDFDSSRTPPKLYTALAISGYSKEEWLQHFSISNQNKIVQGSSGEKVIEFHGSCSDSVIHRKILGYLDWVNKEIEYASELTKNFYDKHRLSFYHKVSNFINSDKYSIVDMKFQVNYKNIINLLMGEALYGNKELGVRELLQNALDACEVKKEMYVGNADLSIYEEYNAKIFIVLDKANKVVIIKDNGIGMNLPIIKNYFLEVGASYYNSDEYVLSNYKYIPIGNYGIGFLSSFMLSDKVKVRTKHFNAEMLYEVDISKDDDFVSIKEVQEPNFAGTEIILNYDQFFEVWEDKEKLKEFIEKEFLADGIQIAIIDKEKQGESIKIYNPNNLLTDSSLIDLSPYLNGVIVKIELSSSSVFQEYLNDIKFYGEPFLFDGKELVQIDEYDELIPLVNYLRDDKLGIIDFAIIESSSDLDEISSIMDSDDDVEDLYREKYDPVDISLITVPELIEIPPRGLIETEEIVDGLTFERFEEEYSHDNSSGTFFGFVSKSFFSKDELNKHIQYSNGHTYLQSNPPFTEKSKLFIRGVFVKDFNFSIMNAIQGVSIKNFLINVVNKEIKPNVSRNDINNDDERLLRNSIYQALLVHFLENLKDPIESHVLKAFMKKFHNYKNTLLNEKYKRHFISEV